MINNRINKPRARRKRRKLKKQEQQERLEEHHRKPVSLGGTNRPKNISLVKGFRHRDWHTLFGNLPAPILFEKLKEDLLKFGFSFSLDLDLYVIKVFVTPKEGNFSHNRSKRKDAWRRLFQDRDLQDIITEINDVWLDPDYFIFLTNTHSEGRTIEFGKAAA